MKRDRRCLVAPRPEREQPANSAGCSRSGPATVAPVDLPASGGRGVLPCPTAAEAGQLSHPK